LSGLAGAPETQQRSIYSAATDAKTCLAEFFQHTRRIDRAARSPWLVIFDLAQSLDLIDLTGDFATRMGASMEIHSGPRGRTRRWACDLYEAFPTADGIFYASSMNGGEPALALTDRAEKRGVLPAHPLATSPESSVTILSVDMPSDKRKWPKPEWESSKKIVIQLPGSANIALQVASFQNIEIQLRFCPSDPANRDRWVAYKAAYHQWVVDMAAWSRLVSQDPHTAGPKPVSPTPPEGRQPDASCVR
jgi:hypothetical protein